MRQETGWAAVGVRLLAGQTVSLDGYVADANGSAGPLYPDLAELQGSGYMNALIEETGAVVMGRRSFEMPGDPDSLADSYEFQVPIFVVTHHPPQVRPRENERLRFTFVTDGVERAVAGAAAAAGAKAVTVVGGMDVIRQLLHAGLVDELRVDVMPVLLGAGCGSSTAHPCPVCSWRRLASERSVPGPPCGSGSVADELEARLVAGRLQRGGVPVAGVRGAGDRRVVPLLLHNRAEPAGKKQ